MTLTEIAAKIDAHLRRFEKDPKINAPVAYGREKLRPYYYARASRAGRFVRVCYISYQGSQRLTRAEAEAYLARLDAGFVGTHYAALC